MQYVVKVAFLLFFKSNRVLNVSTSWACDFVSWNNCNVGLTSSLSLPIIPMSISGISSLK